MKNLYLASALAFICSLPTFSQPTIVVDTVIQTSFCAGGTVLIPYTVIGGNFNFGNIFTAQMSSQPDSDFVHLPCPFEDFDEPMDIGILPYWSSGFMFGQIPDSLTLGLYRIRMISTDPPDTSTISANCILITNLPQFIFSIVGNPSDDTLCQGDSVELSVVPMPVSYLWSTGETSSSIWVKQSGSYTVTARDTAGCETESDPYTVEFEACVGIDEYESQYAFDVYPNPINDIITVDYSASENELAELFIKNLLGQYIVSGKWFNGKVSLNLSDLNPGLYYVELRVAGAVYTRKFIKQ